MDLVHRYIDPSRDTIYGFWHSFILTVLIKKGTMADETDFLRYFNQVMGGSEVFNRQIREN